MRTIGPCSDIVAMGRDCKICIVISQICTLRKCEFNYKMMVANDDVITPDACNDVL